MSLCALVIVVLVGVGFTANLYAQTNTSRWTFVSSPDWFNADVADLSGVSESGQQVVPEAPGWDRGASNGLNGISPQMRGVYHNLVGEMSSRNPELFLVAGDLINGRWIGRYLDPTLDMFDPQSRNRTVALDNAAELYYSWYLWLFRTNGIRKVIPALGDHEIFDNAWDSGSDTASHIDQMKRAFGRNLVDVLDIPDRINGARSRPVGTDFEDTAFAYQHKNVLFVSVDVFRQESPTRVIHPLYRTVSPEVMNPQLSWLGNILSAADTDRSIDHVFVQGHTPVIPPVRMQKTSGTMLVEREDSPLWQLLRRHDHRNGGKVRVYLSGEVHAVTATKDTDSDIIQLVHGDPPVDATPSGQMSGNYVIFRIEPESIAAELRAFQIHESGNSRYWQTNNPSTSGPSSASSSVTQGSMSIDTSRSATRFATSGDLTFLDQTGLAVHFGFDATTPSRNFSNTGEIGNNWYEGLSRGQVITRPGKFGQAVSLNGSDAFVESGRGNITEGEDRTVSAWVSTNSGGTRVILSYGRDASGQASRDVNGRFNFRLVSGRPQVNISRNDTCTASGAPRVDDGEWHHLAVVLTDPHDNRCRDLLYYVDGKQFRASSSDGSEPFVTVPWSNFRIGVDHRGTAGYFSGEIDDLAIWAVPLSRGKAQALANAGNHPQLGYDAAAMQSLYALYDARQGSVTIKGDEWTYATGLQGDAGEVLQENNRLAIQLDDSGGGVATASDDPPPPPPPPSSTSIFEAEEAARSSAFRVKRHHRGYTGSGFVDYVGGGNVTWSVSVEDAGDYDLRFRYALQSGRRPLRILVDDSEAASLPFNSTGDWASWDEENLTVQLSAGTHSIQAQTTGASGPNMDHLRIDGGAAPPPPPPPPPTEGPIYEAEEAARSSTFKVKRHYPGYTGSGFVDYVGNGNITWSVSVAEAGTYVLGFRYALSSGNRPLDILVDGSTVAAAKPFPGTGDWANWNVVRVTTQLSAGTHTVRAQSTGRSGANLDHLSVAKSD